MYGRMNQVIEQGKLNNDYQASLLVPYHLTNVKQMSIQGKTKDTLDVFSNRRENGSEE